MKRGATTYHFVVDHLGSVRYDASLDAAGRAGYRGP